MSGAGGAGGAGGMVVWFTGLPSAGKSTLAAAVRRRLVESGRAVALLDSDEIRTVCKPKPGYALAERDAFYRTLGGLAGVLAGQGLVVLVPATAHQRVWRDAARAVAPRFLEVYVATPASTCAARDTKGLWEGARTGRVTAVPGVDAAYEPPAHPDVIAAGGADDDAAARVVLLIRGE